MIEASDPIKKTPALGILQTRIGFHGNKKNFSPKCTLLYIVESIFKIEQKTRKNIYMKMNR